MLTGTRRFPQLLPRDNSFPLFSPPPCSPLFSVFSLFTVHPLVYAFYVENEPEIWETEEEKPLSIGQLKYQYRQFARKNFQGKVFTNKDTRKQIRVSADGIMEWWRKSRKREHVISMQLLDYFLENGIFIEENPDYKNRPEIESASLFESACKINEKSFRVILTIRKGVDDNAKFRYYTLRNIKIMPA